MFADHHDSFILGQFASVSCDGYENVNAIYPQTDRLFRPRRDRSTNLLLVFGIDDDPSMRSSEIAHSKSTPNQRAYRRTMFLPRHFTAAWSHAGRLSATLRPG